MHYDWRSLSIDRHSLDHGRWKHNSNAVDIVCGESKRPVQICREEGKGVSRTPRMTAVRVGDFCQVRMENDAHLLVPLVETGTGKQN